MVSEFLVRLSVATLALVLLAASGAAAATPNAGGNWQVVVAAGDDAEPVFDNATRELRRRLIAAGVPASNIHRLSARSILGANVEPASSNILLQRIAELPARPGDRCLVFLTSHGERGEGLWLARSNAALKPDQLAQALSQGCAAVPTVVIVSACYSGIFTRGKMAKPNRIIVTAARGDRPSFGCQAHRIYSFFDECLLSVSPKPATWRAEFNASARCVRQMEQQLGIRPSEPQAYFGAAVRELEVGF